MKLSITEKWRNKAKNRTRNSVKLKLVRLTNSVKSLWYINYYSWSSTRHVKRSILSFNSQEICSWTGRPETILKVTKKIVVQVVFSRRPLTIILKYKGNRWDFLFTQTHVERISYCIWEFDSQFFRSSIGIVSGPVAIEVSKGAFTFLIVLESTEILCSLKLVPHG